MQYHIHHLLWNFMLKFNITQKKFVFFLQIFDIFSEFLLKNFQFNNFFPAKEVIII